MPVRLFVSLTVQVFGTYNLSFAQADVDALLEDSSFYGAELSPSGAYLSGVRWENDEEYVVVADLNADTLRLESSRIPNARVNWIEWASEERLLVSVTVYVDRRGRQIDLKTYWDDPDQIAIPVSRLLSMNKDGSEPVLMFEDDRRFRRSRGLANITSFLEDDPDHVLMPARLRGDLDLFKVNVRTGENERIAVGGQRTIGWFVDDEGTPAFRVDVNRRFTRLTYFTPESRANGEIKWRKSRTIRLDERRDEDKEQTEFRPLRPGPDLNSYYVIARPKGQETSGVYLYDIENDEFLETLATHPDLDISIAFFYENTDEFAGYAYYEDRLTYKLEDGMLQAHMNGLNAYFSELANVRIMDVSEDDDRWLLYAFGPQDSGSWHIYDVSAANAREIGARMKNVPRSALAPMQVIDYVARDGLEITGYLTRPLNAEPDDKPPLIVMPHGGPELRDYYTYNRQVQVLAALGYQVFQPNFRGSDGYGKTFVERGHRQWGRAMQDDIDDGYGHLVDIGLAQDGSACIYGASYGGYAALVAAMRNSGDYECAISVAGPSDLRKLMTWIRKEDGHDSEAYEYVIKQIGHPRADREAIDAVSPALHAERIEMPVLLLHGEYDNVVPIKQSKLMTEALEDANKDVRMITLEDSGHSSRSPASERLEHDEIVAFLDTHLPTSSSASALSDAASQAENGSN